MALRQCLGSRDDFREVSGEVPPGLRQHRDLFPAPSKEATKSIPLRLVLPLGAFRNRRDRSRFHRLIEIVASNPFRHRSKGFRRCRFRNGRSVKEPRRYPLRPAADLHRRQVGSQAACEVSACLFTSDSARPLRVASVFFSSFSVASSSLTASLRPSSAAQVFSEP